MKFTMKRKSENTIDSSQTKIPKLESTSFGPAFRRKLKTGSAITAVQEFVAANKKGNVADQYVNAGGSVNELLDLIKQFDGQNNFSVASTIFSAISHVVSRVVSDLLLKQDAAEEACKEMLKTYQDTIQNMLNGPSSTTSHKKVILKLFTAIVTLSGNLARIILSSFPFTINSLRTLTNPSSSAKSSKKLRTCFIHFLLSFLADANSVLISEVLQKKGLLISIIPGLIHDSPETVVLVLDTLRTKIVENVKISKTLKLHTFNTSVLRMLSTLYDFRERPSNNEEESTIEDDEPGLKINSVRGAVHELLLLLCTSSKKGILFRQQSSASNTNPNQLVFTLLEGIDKPWQNLLKCDLIATILQICPEFVESIFPKWKMELYPRVSNDWIEQIDFVKQVLENRKITAPVVGREMCAKITVLFPPFVQKIFLRNIDDPSIHPHPVVRYNLMRLLRTVLQNISDALETHSISTNVREEIAQILQKIVFPCNKLLVAWKLGVVTIVSEDDANQNNVYSNTPEKEEYYLVLLDVLLLYQTLIPICLTELRTTEVVNFDDYYTIVDSSEYRYKLARLVFATFNPKPTEPSFNFIVKQFVEYYVQKDDIELLAVIENVLRATGLFASFESEIIVWLRVLKEYNLGDLFVEALGVAAENNKKFSEQLSEWNQRFSSEEKDDVGKTDFDSIDEIGTLLDMEEGSLATSSPPIAVSPVVLAFLHILETRKYKKDARKDSVRNFMSAFLVHLMHLQSSVEHLKKLIEENKSAYIESKVRDFISFWSQDDCEIDCPPYLLDSEEITPLVYSCLLETGSIDEIIQCVNNARETEIVLAWNACVFYTIRLVQMNALDSDKRNSVSEILKQLLRKMPRARATSCLELLLTNRYLVDCFVIERTKKDSTLSIILMDVVINSNSDSSSSYSHLTLPYRYKLITSIMNRRKRSGDLKINREGFTIDRLVKFATLSDRTRLALLQMLIPMPVSKYVVKGRPSEWSELIVCLLDAAAESMETPLDHEHFVLLISRLNEARKTAADVEKFSEGVIRYIRIFSHHVRHIPEDLVEDICRNSSPQLYKLAAYLITHHQSFGEVLQEQIATNTSSLEIDSLLEILDRIQKVATIDEKILKNVRKSHLNDLTAILSADDDNLWLKKEYRKWTEKIVSQLSSGTSSNIRRKIEAILPTMQLDENKCAILKIVFEKTDATLSYVKLLMEKFNELLSKNQDVSWLCDEITRNVSGGEVDLSDLVTSPLWQNFVKWCLKISLQTDNARIMRTFKDVCEKALSENSTEASALIFQMTISHSAFVGKMLSNSSLKIELIELLLVLTRLNPSVMTSNHVPLLLSAYRASLAKSDQLLLQLLQWYENNDIRFSDCRPYLWGESAASHYSIRNEMSVSLSRQPSPNQVLELFDSKIVSNTVRSYPLDRPLWPKTCCSMDTLNVYDLSFMLPLLSHLLAPESRISIQRFCRSGALCLVLTALSSEDSNVRMAGYHCLQRFDERLFSREKEVQIWQQFLNALKNGLNTSENGQENGTEPPRLACLVTTFLSNMSLIICEPLNSLYAPTSNFLLAKPSFELNTIPNFFTLFYSTDLTHRDHQKWMLKVIRDGMRYEKDWIVAQKNFIFKFLLQYYGSSLSSASLNVIILQILANALEIERCRLFLVTKGSLLSWIAQVVRNTTTDSRSSFPALLRILKSLISGKHAKNVSNLLILLLRKLMSFDAPSNQSVSEEVLQLLSNTYCLCANSNANALSKKDVEVVLELANPLLNVRARKLFDNVLKHKSVLFLDELCDSGNIENCISRVLQLYVRRNRI